MRVDFPIYASDPFRYQLDDLRMEGSDRSSAGLSARFQEALWLTNMETAVAEHLSTDDTIQNQIEVMPIPLLSAGESDPPVTRWTRSVAPGSGGEEIGAQRAGQNSAATNNLVDVPDDRPGKNPATDGAARSRQDPGATQAKRNSTAAPSGIRSTATAASSAHVPDPVVKTLIHTPIGTIDPNNRVKNLVLNVAANSPAEVYFVTHAPAEWRDDPAAVARFTELYGEKAAGVLKYFGTVPKHTDPVWLATPEQLARIDDEGDLLLSLQDYYHMTGEMAKMANFHNLFPDIDTDLPFIPSSQPFMAPSELAKAAPAMLAKLNAAAPVAFPAANGSHRGA